MQSIHTANDIYDIQFFCSNDDCQLPCLGLLEQKINRIAGKLFCEVSIKKTCEMHIQHKKLDPEQNKIKVCDFRWVRKERAILGFERDQLKEGDKIVFEIDRDLSLPGTGSHSLLEINAFTAWSLVEETGRPFLYKMTKSFLLCSAKRNSFTGDGCRSFVVPSALLKEGSYDAVDPHSSPFALVDATPVQRGKQPYKIEFFSRKQKNHSLFPSAGFLEGKENGVSKAIQCSVTADHDCEVFVQHHSLSRVDNGIRICRDKLNGKRSLVFTDEISTLLKKGESFVFTVFCTKEKVLGEKSLLAIEAFNKTQDESIEKQKLSEQRFFLVRKSHHYASRAKIKKNIHNPYEPVSKIEPGYDLGEEGEI